jgi:nicotinic acid mononucleotide adenylyltransferase
MSKILFKNQSILILGGSFNPPHRGHLHIVKTAMRETEFLKTKTCILPAKQNPFKKNSSTKIMVYTC